MEENQVVESQTGTVEEAEKAMAETQPEELKETPAQEAPAEEPTEAPAGEPADAGGEAPAEEREEDPFLKYIRQAFAKEHIDEFMQTLTDDQKSFIYVFCSGFETAIGRHIVGVYDTAYIEGYHFTKEVLDSLRIIVKPVDVKDTNLKFTIVAQLV